MRRGTYRSAQPGSPCSAAASFAQAALDFHRAVPATHIAASARRAPREYPCEYERGNRRPRQGCSCRKRCGGRRTMPTRSESRAFLFHLCREECAPHQAILDVQGGRSCTFACKRQEQVRETCAGAGGPLLSPSRRLVEQSRRRVLVESA